MKPLVADVDGSFVAAFFERKRLIDFLYFPRFCGKGTVGENNAGAAIISVIGLIAEIAAISHVITVISCRHSNRPVYPVPDELPHQSRILFVQIEIFAQIADAVALSQVVFALDMRFDRFSPVEILQAGYSGGFDVIDRRIHGAGNIAVLAVSFVMGGTSRVQGFDRFGRVVECDAATGFVSQGPDDDGGMIFVAFNQVDRSFHDGFPVGRFVGEVPIVVTFHVCLRQYIESVLIAERIKIGIVWIV